MPDSSTLRQIWLIIDQTQTLMLLSLSDSELIQRIQGQLKAQRLITNSELNAVGVYINSRIPLIRDLAASRLSDV